MQFSNVTQISEKHFLLKEILNQTQNGQRYSSFNQQQLALILEIYATVLKIKCKMQQKKNKKNFKKCFFFS